MSGPKSKNFTFLLEKLERYGFLLQTDAHFPSVVSLVVGQRVRGSWWSHPEADRIYDLSNQLFGWRQSLVMKLLSGKLTLVHRRWWPAIYSIAAERADWQMDGLSVAAKALLSKVDREGELKSDWLVELGGYASKELSALINELEKRLLLFSEQFHTERGKHARYLESWLHWAVRAKFQPENILPLAARTQIYDRVSKLNSEFGAAAKLPWPKA